MKKIADILTTIIMLPFKILKWSVYCVLTFTLLFGLGFAVDRYIGWHPSLKPVRDSTLKITIGLVHKATPYLEKVAAKFDPKAPNTPEKVADKLPQEVKKISEVKKTQKVQKKKMVKAEVNKLEDVFAQQKKKLEATVEKLTHVLKKNSLTSFQKEQTVQKWKYNLLIGIILIETAIMVIIAVLLYLKWPF